MTKILAEELKHSRTENAYLRKILQLQTKLDDLDWKYKRLSESFNECIKWVDVIFQNQDGILPRYLKLGDDKFKGCFKLAKQFKELCDFCADKKLGYDLYNSLEKFKELINYERQ